MAKISQYFKDKAKTIKDYPKTLMKAVYGDDGKRLDNIISDITSNIDSTKAKIGTTDISKYGDGTVTGAIKAACDKSDANETAIADVNSKLGNTDISSIGDGTVTGGLNALNSNLDEFKYTLGSSESIKIDTSYYTDSISIQFNSSYKIDGLKMAFIYTKLTNSSPYPSNAVWGRVSCPPKSLIDIPAFVKTTTDQWVPFYITIDTNGEIRQNLTGEAQEIWICGSYIY